MSDSTADYRAWILANKPTDITQDRYGFWQYNGHKFPTYLQCKWYRDALIKHQKDRTT